MTEGFSLGGGGRGWACFQQWMRILAAHSLHYQPGLDYRLLLFWLCFLHQQASL